jgi:hypothetical protein
MSAKPPGVSHQCPCGRLLVVQKGAELHINPESPERIVVLECKRVEGRCLRCGCVISIPGSSGSGTAA